MKCQMTGEGLEDGIWFKKNKIKKPFILNRQMHTIKYALSYTNIHLYAFVALLHM